jgi:NTP pyrophosphatase (non-canonical NTP hydrolase)/phosphopantetheinyl transferase (holo-ACP synthase)
MLIARYAKDVADTDQFKDRPAADRRRISILGLVSEIGSVISAVKKQRLGEGGRRDKAEGLLTRNELLEELGDVMWYCFALAALEEQATDDILSHQLDSLRRQLEGDDAGSLLFKELLKPENLEKFRQRTAAFPGKRSRTFKHFQDTAILTARTGSAQLVEISLAVLMQLGAQLMRGLLPDTERQIHDEIDEVSSLEILGRIAWHVAAIATVYGISLNDVAKANIEKAQLRRPKAVHTPLHDEDRPDIQKFPRRFEIKFLTVGEGLSRMYLNGRQLGDDLNDNSYYPDGYRFHDVLHLANVAHLGWSPVVRGMMKRKRKDDQNPKLDQVEDGARAKIVEEAILKVIHSEGSDIAAIVHPDLPREQRPLFSDEVDIPLSFFKLIRRYVRDLEVEKNSFEEWKSAIRDGCRVYKKLVDEGQGTVYVDLNKRTITFKPEVHVELAGPAAGIGSFAISLDVFDEAKRREAETTLTDGELQVVAITDARALAVHYAAKRAVLQSLGLDAPTQDHMMAIALTPMGSGRFSVKAKPPLQELMWERAIVAFKPSVTCTQNSVYCTVLAVSQPPKD